MRNGELKSWQNYLITRSDKECHAEFLTFWKPLNSTNLFINTSKPWKSLLISFQYKRLKLINKIWQKLRTDSKKELISKRLLLLFDAALILFWAGQTRESFGYWYVQLARTMSWPKPRSLRMPLRPQRNVSLHFLSLRMLQATLGQLNCHHFSRLTFFLSFLCATFPSTVSTSRSLSFYI